MTWIEDGSTAHWFPGLDAPGLLVAVGWLERDAPFETGPVERSLVERLEELKRLPFHPPSLPVTGGVHPCGLCQFPDVADGRLLFVPGDGHLYLVPALITHYIAAHWYRPPEAFIAAVERCPDPGTMAFRRAYLENGGRQLQSEARRVYRSE